MSIFLYVFLLHNPIIKRFFQSKNSNNIYFNIYIALLVKSLVNCLGPLYGIIIMISNLFLNSINLSFKTPKT